MAFPLVSRLSALWSPAEHRATVVVVRRKTTFRTAKDHWTTRPQSRLRIPSSLSDCWSDPVTYVRARSVSMTASMMLAAV